MYCTNCGAENKATSKFCENCGKPLYRPDNTPVLNGVRYDFTDNDADNQNKNKEKRSYYDQSHIDKGNVPQEAMKDSGSNKGGVKKGCMIGCLAVIIGAVFLAFGCFMAIRIMHVLLAGFSSHPGGTSSPVTPAITSPTPVPITIGSDYNIISSVFSDEIVKEHQVHLKGDGKDKVTVLVYMNGSNLESEDGEATEDLAEMISAGSSDMVNVVVQTMGTKKWKKYGIANNRSQVYEVNGSGLKLVKDDLGQKDCTAMETLRDFIAWGAKTYPADRYILLFWDHGGGPVYGFGYDEYQDSSALLSIDEMQAALKQAGVYFDFIGMDCCLMSSMEVCCALYDYCDYTILSEDFEPGLGWSYKGWLAALYDNTGISTPDLGKIIVDDMVNANAKNGGDNAILALLDQSAMKLLYTAWKDFAYANETTLLNKNYSYEVHGSGRELPAINNRGISDWFFGSDDEYSLSDYYITDIFAVAENIDSKEKEALQAALSAAVVYAAATSKDAGLCGLSVTLPYGDSRYYASLKRIFSECGFDSEYIAWLEKFVGQSNADSFFNYDSWFGNWGGWDDYEDDYDWGDWDYYKDDSYWSDEDDWGWDDWDFGSSWNSWLGGLIGNIFGGSDDYWDDDYWEDGWDDYWEEEEDSWDFDWWDWLF